MPATVPTRGVLKASQNRVRTSVSLQGNAMWENVIGIVNEQAGTNQGVEALINAPQHGGGRKATLARRAAAAEAVMATGGFDTAITNYASLLSLAKSQGAVGGGGTRGACRVCGQLGHLTKQCRNQFSKYYDAGAGDGAADPLAAAQAALAAEAAEHSGLSSSGLSGSDSDSSDSEAERRRRRKEKKRKERKEKKSKSSDRDRKHKSKKHKKEKKESRDKDRKSSKKRRRSSSGSGSGSD